MGDIRTIPSTVPQKTILGNQRESGSNTESGTVGGLPPNGTFSLWQMLMAIMKYEKTVLDNSAQMQKNWAQNLGGSDGIYAKLYTIGCNVGEQEADGLRADAISKFVQTGVSGASLGFSAGKYLLSTRPAINAGQAGLDDASNMENAIHKSDAGLLIKENENANIDPKVQARLKGWADGSEPVNNFKGVNEEEAKINEQAAKHSANDKTQQEKILKRVKEQKDSCQGQITQANRNFDEFVQFNSIATNGLNNAAGATGSIAQADAAAKKGQSNASQSIVSQVQQQIVTAQNKAEQNAQDALQQANQWAAGFASAASAQVHG
jgi:hypothetical protein